MGEPIYPPERREVDEPSVFFVGAIKGAERWQDRGIELLQERDPRITPLSPRRALDRAKDYSEDVYISQVDWETDHLRIAAGNGVIIAWFAKEKEHFCERPFARTTRIEFGEWMAHHELEDTRLVVGFEEGFDGEHYIRHRLQAYPRIPICTSLEDCVKTAVELIAIDRERKANLAKQLAEQDYVGKWIAVGKTAEATIVESNRDLAYLLEDLADQQIALGDVTLSRVPEETEDHLAKVMLMPLPALL